jgi:hypothetical protein
VVIAVAVVVASGGGKNKPTVDATTSVDLQLGDLTVESVSPFKGNAEDFPRETADAALALVESYVHEATVVPLRSGTAKPAALGKVFDDAAIARLGVADRDQVLDEGLRKAVGKVTVNGAPVALTALMNSDGTIVLVSAAVDLDIKAQAAKGTITITRTGTLVLLPLLDGTWKVTGWTLHVERGGPGVVPTPTTTVAT